jgi:methylmalonyl-CoA mutase
MCNLTMISRYSQRRGLYKPIAGKALFVVAEYPPCTDELKAAGVEHFISKEIKCLETLQMFQQILE